MDIRNLVLSLVLLCIPWFVSASSDVHEASPVGIWQTRDEQTQIPGSLIKIWVDEKNQELKGRVHKIYYLDPKKAIEFCSQCPGDLHGKPVLGMTILWGMYRDGEYWVNGRVMDVRNGRIYRANLKVSADNQLLFLRGYIGHPILGRTATW